MLQFKQAKWSLFRNLTKNGEMEKTSELMWPRLLKVKLIKKIGMEQIFRVKRNVSSNWRTILIGKDVKIQNGCLI